MDTGSWFLPVLDADTRARVVEFVREHSGLRFRYVRTLGDRGRAGLQEVLATKLLRWTSTPSGWPRTAPAPWP